MPYKTTKVESGFKVVNKDTGHVYAYHTKNPKKLIAAIEISKIKNNGAKKH